MLRPSKASPDRSAALIPLIARQISRHQTMCNPLSDERIMRRQLLQKSATVYSVAVSVCVCDSKSLPICNFVATAHLATDSKYAVERFWKPVYLQRPRTASNCSSASQHLPCHYTPGSRSNLGDEEKLGRRASHKESCDIFNA